MPLEHRQRVTLDHDYYEPFAISQGIRAGDLLFLSGPDWMIEIEATALIRS